MVEAAYETLLEAIADRAGRDPSGEAVLVTDRKLRLDELWRGIVRFTGHLLGLGIGDGDRVVIALPNGEDFLFAFYGVQRAGCIAVPLYPDSGPERLVDVAGLCDAAAVVATPEAAGGRLSGLTRRAELALLTVDEALEASPPEAPPRIDPDQVAFIQYTSGSTGSPKGVQLSHADLITNLRQMIAGMEITRDEIFVSWLPMFHDMGLILMTMAPLYLGARLVLLPTSLDSIRRWLAVMAEHRGTFTAAPDFAYRLVQRLVREPASLDLSSLRVALNAAEPVRAGTITAFEESFGLGSVMSPAYGLAEATVGVSMWPPGLAAKVDERGLVSVGSGFPAVELAIVGEGRPVSAGEVGEVVVRSPANTRGYWANPEATRELQQHGGIRTGDLGYLDADGDLFIVGRLKNIIIQAGRNIAPQEVEETVDALPFVRMTAAVGVDRGRLEGEQVYVFAEIRETGEPRYSELAVEVVRAVDDRLGTRPGRVYLVKPRTIPKTHNGKVQHAVLRDAYLDGSLRAAGQILYPGY